MDFLWHLTFIISNWIPSALAYNLIFGKGKILHFGPVGVSVAAAYATFITLSMTQSYALAILSGTIVSLLISALFAWLSLRLEPDGLGVMSIAVHLALLAIVLNSSSLTRGALGIPRIPRMPGLESLEAIAIVSMLFAAASVLFFLAINRSAFGRQVAALAEHSSHASALGISRTRVHFVVFAIAGLIAVMINLLFPQYIHLLHPNDYQFVSLIFFVMFVVAGKPGSVWGVTFATILILLLKEGLRFVHLPADILGPTRLILFGLILFGAVWLRRDSLFPPQRKI
jgi:branched-chain amino acid transport system permease protein